jgi:hypothetical protein
MDTSDVNFHEVDVKELIELRTKLEQIDLAIVETKALRQRLKEVLKDCNFSPDVYKTLVLCVLYILNESQDVRQAVILNSVFNVCKDLSKGVPLSELDKDTFGFLFNNR